MPNNTEESVVMHRSIKDSMGREVKSVSYVDYNRVKIVTNYDEVEWHSFDNAKEAVDFYIDKMQNIRML